PWSSLKVDCRKSRPLAAGRAFACRDGADAARAACSRQSPSARGRKASPALAYKNLDPATLPDRRPAAHRKDPHALGAFDPAEMPPSGATAHDSGPSKLAKSRNRPPRRAARVDRFRSFRPASTASHLSSRDERLADSWQATWCHPRFDPENEAVRRTATTRKL